MKSDRQIIRKSVKLADKETNYFFFILGSHSINALTYKFLTVDFVESIPHKFIISRFS